MFVGGVLQQEGKKRAGFMDMADPLGTVACLGLTERRSAADHTGEQFSDPKKRTRAMIARQSAASIGSPTVPRHLNGSNSIQ